MAKLSNKHVDRGAFEKAKQKILASQKTEKKKRGALENVSYVVFLPSNWLHCDRVPSVILGAQV